MIVWIFVGFASATPSMTASNAETPKANIDPRLTVRGVINEYYLANRVGGFTDEERPQLLPARWWIVNIVGLPLGSCRVLK
jgi:hypothetical protein